MPTTLEAQAIDRSTYAVTARFVDESGLAMTPNAGLTWTLTNPSGKVINNRLAVPIASAETVTVVLHGADLDATVERLLVLTIEGTYDSSLGNDLDIRDQVTFPVKNLIAVVS